MVNSVAWYVMAVGGSASLDVPYPGLASQLCLQALAQFGWHWRPSASACHGVACVMVRLPYTHTLMGTHTDMLTV